MSNKHQKKQIREAKKLAEQRSAQVISLLIKVVAVVLIPLVVFVLYQGLFSGAPIVAPDEIVASDHVRGDDNAPVTMTIYADFQCPQCLNEEEIVAQAWSQISDKVQLVFRYFPLDTHRHGFLSARYAEAAGMQGHFWEMHNLLFANQVLWSGLADANSMFEGYAAEIGLDIDQLRIDLEADSVRDKIIADQQGGIRAGVRGVPVMFLNGRRVNNPRSAGELIAMVNKQI